MNLIYGNLVVTIGAEPDDDSLRLLQNDILDKIETATVKAVLIDVSNVRIIDGRLFSVLVDISKMVRLLGSKVVFAGFRAGVASALVDLDVDLDVIDTALTVEDAMESIDAAFSEINVDHVTDDLDDPAAFHEE